MTLSQTKPIHNAGVCLLLGLFLTSCDSSTGVNVITSANANNNAVGANLNIEVLSASDHLRVARVCLDVNSNLQCDADEPSGESDSEGRVSLDPIDPGNLTNKNVLAEVMIGKTQSAGGVTARARYTMLASVSPEQSPLLISPLSTYTTLRAKAQNVSMDAALADVARRLGLPSGTPTDTVLTNYLTLSETNASLAASLKGHAINIENAIKRVGLTAPEIVDDIVENVTQAVAEGKQAGSYFVYPIGNQEDGNRLSYTVDENGRADLASINLQCHSQVRRHAGEDIKLVDSDPLHQYQWHITGVGRWINSELANLITPGADINAVNTYLDGYTGACVRVAVVDTPVSFEHPDLIANAIPLGSVNQSFGLSEPGTMLTDSDKFDPRPAQWAADEIVAHGTSVAGIIAASSGNSEGGRGVAPGALIRSFSSKFSGAEPPELDAEDEQSEGTYIGTQDPQTHTNESDAERNLIISETRALGDALFNPHHPQLSQVDILNYSGSLHSEPARLGRNMPVVVRESLRAGTSTLRDNLGALYVVSSGNGFEPSNEACAKYGVATQNGAQTLMPCQITAVMDQQNSPYTIIVGAHTSEGKVTSYSTPGTAMWITAPSNDRVDNNDGTQRFWPGILAPDIEGCELGFSSSSTEGGSTEKFEQGKDESNHHCDYTSAFGGTSASAPVVSGALALLLEKHPQLNWRQARYTLAKSAVQLQPDTAPVFLDVNGEQYEALSGWIVNAAGFPYHYRYGFGGLDVDKAVAVADAIFAGNDSFGAQLGQTVFEELPWVTAPVKAEPDRVPDNSTSGLISQLSIPESENRTIEAVQLSLNLTGARTSDLSVELVSPAGTKSILWSARNEMRQSSFDPLPDYVAQNEPPADLAASDRHGRTIYLGDFREPTAPEFSAATWYSTDGVEKKPGLVLLSNQFYGEESAGVWQLRIFDTATGDQDYGEIVFDTQTMLPEVDADGDYVTREVTVSNPEERILKGWAVKIFGHVPSR